MEVLQFSHNTFYSCVFFGLLYCK